MAAHRVFALLALGLAMAAAGCTRTVSLGYSPPGTTSAAIEPGLVSVRPFRDARKNGAHELGRVRGVFGTAIKRVRTEQPVAAEVTRAFEEALAARGLLASGQGGALTLVGEVRKLDCNHYHQREAHAELSLELVDATGRVVLQRQYESHHVGGGGFTSGVFASRRKLAALAERTLAGAIDAALSDPAFVVAASGGPGTRRAAPVTPGGPRAAPAAPRESSPPAPGSAPLTETDRKLRALDKLYEQGRLSDEEYARHRARLLGAL